MFEILEEADKQEILQQSSENSRPQIVFRTEIFRKLILGAPEHLQLFRKAANKADNGRVSAICIRSHALKLSIKNLSNAAVI